MLHLIPDHTAMLKELEKYFGVAQSTAAGMPASMPLSMMDAVTNGINISIKTSRAVKIGVRMCAKACMPIFRLFPSPILINIVRPGWLHGYARNIFLYTGIQIIIFSEYLVKNRHCFTHNSKEDNGKKKEDAQEN